MLFVSDLFCPLKARVLSPERASFCIYVWKNGKIHGIAPRQINCFQSNQYLAKTNRVAYIIKPSWRNSPHSDKNRSQSNDWLVPYLLSRESQPVCDHCKCHLMVKHMLLECPSTAVIRHKYFSSTTLKELFSNVDARCILDFTKERLLPSYLNNFLVDRMFLF